MKRNFIFALILLGTFSIINAVQFGPCPIKDHPEIVQLDVKLNPDPLVPGQSLTVTISGKLNVDVTQDTLAYADVGFYDTSHNILAPLVYVEFCKDIACPVKAGTEFSKVLTINVPSDINDWPFFAIKAHILDEPNHAFLGCAISGYMS